MRVGGAGRWGAGQGGVGRGCERCSRCRADHLISQSQQEAMRGVSCHVPRQMSSKPVSVF
ncbi:hypothetical protein E2C01_080376 [Portunus trituberculatus]|uniref:Uncharacterized protein n=1 Tax=Portunus trituberculatus TaxID=210409 RepID=A0A5B7IT33_PORTR|nr:hypothetical protein [Portunus trituberculatus]